MGDKSARQIIAEHEAKYSISRFDAEVSRIRHDMIKGIEQNMNDMLYELLREYKSCDAEV